MKMNPIAMLTLEPHPTLVAEQPKNKLDQLQLQAPLRESLTEKLMALGWLPVPAPQIH